MTRWRKLLLKYTQKILQTAFFSDEKILKVKQLYNSLNYLVSKKMRKVEVPEKKLFSEIETFSKQIMVSVAISKANKTSIFLLNRIQSQMWSIIVMYYWRKWFLKWTSWQNIMSIYSGKVELGRTQPSLPLKCSKARNNFDYWSPTTSHWIVLIRIQ